MAGWILLLGGLAATAWGAFEMARRQQARHWPQVQGEVRHARLEAVAAGNGGVCFRLRVSYRYFVDGNALLGDRIRFGAEELFDSLWEAESVLTRYEAGKTIAVRYDPRRPEEAVLDVDEIDGFAFAAAGGAAAALLGTALLLT